MTFPRLKALRAAWHAVPPVPIALARIARYLGMPEPKGQAGQGSGAPAPGAAPSSAAEILAAFGGQGMAVLRTRPQDPALDAAGF